VFDFLGLILKNLGRNRLRTTLTGLAVGVLVTICVEMLAVTLAARERLSNSASRSKLVVTERWVLPGQVPRRFLPELTSLPGVEDWTVWSYYGGYFDQSLQLDRAAVGVATRPENLVAMHANLAGVDPAAVEALRQEKDGVLVGVGVMRTMGWQVGQRFTFNSVSHPGKDLRFHVVGVLPAGDWARGFVFRDDYFKDATGDKDAVGCVWLRTAGPEEARRVADRVEKDYASRDPELKVETESAGAARFTDRGQAVLSLIELVVAILLADMVVVLANSIGMATRERRVEMAVLKVLGFKPRLVMALVVGEAVLVGAFSGLGGAAWAWGTSALVVSGVLPPSPLTDNFLLFPVQPLSLLWGTLLGAGVGLAGSIVPAWAARRVQVSDVFAKIA
jgi:putative ABC transport system permease protein